MWKADRRLYKTQDGLIVEEGDVRAYRLYATPGVEVQEKPKVEKLMADPNALPVDASIMESASPEHTAGMAAPANFVEQNAERADADDDEPKRAEKAARPVSNKAVRKAEDK